MASLNGRVGIVTGAGRGLGRAYALALAAAGARVVVNDPGCALDGSGSDATPAAGVVAEIEAMGGEALANLEAVGGPEAAQGLVAQTMERFGRLDFLINNAGISQATPLIDVEHEQWNRILTTHLGGTYTCAQAALREMVRAGRGGRIINTTSGAGLGRAYPGSAAYAAAKGAIAALTRVIATEGEPDSITCNAISPLASTRMSGGFLAGQSDGGGAESASALTVYLASEASSGVTGQVFRAAEGRLGAYTSPIPEGCTSQADTWTVEEISIRIEEIIGC